MEQSKTGLSAAEPSDRPRACLPGGEPGSGEYSFTRVMVVFLFSHIVGLFGGIAFMLILLAPLALPWWFVISLLGEEIGPLAILLTGGGFASGCFLNIQLPRFRTRFLLLFTGNPAFLLFLAVVLNPGGIGMVRFPGFYLDQRMEIAALFAAFGAFCAVLGDRYASRRKEEAGIG
jgi:hypothetical protein